MNKGCASSMRLLAAHRAKNFKYGKIVVVIQQIQTKEAFFVSNKALAKGNRALDADMRCRFLYKVHVLLYNVYTLCFILI